MGVLVNATMTGDGQKALVQVILHTRTLHDMASEEGTKLRQ